jgi:hypothetical protein
MRTENFFNLAVKSTSLNVYIKNLKNYSNFYMHMSIQNLLRKVKLIYLYWKSVLPNEICLIETKHNIKRKNP